MFYSYLGNRPRSLEAEREVGVILSIINMPVHMFEMFIYGKKTFTLLI